MELELARAALCFAPGTSSLGLSGNFSSISQGLRQAGTTASLSRKAAHPQNLRFLAASMPF